MTRENNATDISLILFDLGGVLLHLRETRSNFGIAAGDSQFHRSWLMSPAVREFERGAIDANEFARRITGEFRLPYDWQEFLLRFDRWPERLYQGVVEMLVDLSARYALALLSNTNAVHWGREDIAGVLEPLFDHAFLSFQTGLLKPDRAAFDQVMAHYDCEAQNILFLDDNPLNVGAANAIGIRAYLSRGLDGIRGTLATTGVLTS